MKKILLLCLTFKFFGLVANTNLDKCDDHLCKNQTASKSCFCTECDAYSDCCVDKQISTPKSNNFECNVRIKANEYIYSISKCANPDMIVSDELKSSCENLNENGNINTNILSLVPVYVNRTGFVYRNVYCARCNVDDLIKDEVEFFKMVPNYRDAFFIKYRTGQISSIEFRNGLIDNPNQVFILDRKKPIDFRHCLKTINTCPEKNDTTIKQFCQNHTAIVQNLQGTPYKNKYCAMCHNETESSLTCYRKLYSVKTLQILFDISDLLDTDFNDSTSSPILENNSTQSIVQCTSEIVKSYLTVTGLIISIISILALLVIYFMNETLRNFPGKLLICLSLSILFSQSFFLVATYITESKFKKENTKNYFEIQIIGKEVFKSCYIFGFLTHYFYLASFTWSNIMGFDLYRIFSILISSSAFDDQELRDARFKKYSIYGWLAPLIPVSILFGKQFLNHKLAYGFGQCFISEKIDLLYFFILPIALILFSNLIFLMISICSIIKVDKMTHKVMKKEKSEDEIEAELIKSKKFNLKKIFNKKKLEKSEKCTKEKKRLSLFIKLFLLTGMTWILGLITSVNSDSFLWYIYIILNSLQGLFVFASFAFNSQTRRELIKYKAYRTISERLFSIKSESLATSSTNPDLANISKKQSIK